ncbi:MAG: hypothetical protein QME51_09585, partial [Planctomycetota bacterium]|nr:hypothetical protein [Planctomycetota bacterium]
VSNYQPNNYIKTPSGEYTGEDKNGDGSGDNNESQSVDSSPAAPYYWATERPVTYYIKIVNEGTVTSTYTVTGSAAPANWAVSYYTSGIGDITNAVTTIGYAFPDVAPAGHREIWAVISPTLGLAAGSSSTIYIRAFSQQGGGFSDTVKAVTTVRPLYFPDLHIKRSFDVVDNYQGMDSYVEEGAGWQTSLASYCATGQVVSFHIRIQNDGTADATYTLTGSSAEANWTVSYYDHLGEEQTGLFTTSGWVTPNNIAAGQSITITARASHNGTPPVGVPVYHYIRARAVSLSAQRDTVRLMTIPAGIDASVALPSYATYDGQGYYNADGLFQTDTIQNVPTQQTVTYSIKIKNDGTTPIEVTYTASPSAGGWTVTYYNGLSTSDPQIPYNEITSEAGWLRPGTIGAGAEVYLCVEVTPVLTVFGGSAGEYINYVKTISVSNPSLQDTIRTRTRVEAIHRADAGVSDALDGPFVDMSITSTDGATQTITRTIIPLATTTYYIRVENDGNLSDTFSITGTDGLLNNWVVTYYDWNNVDISGSITGSGFSAGPLTPTMVDPNDYKTIRAEVSPLTTTHDAVYTIFVRSHSSGAGFADEYSDTIRADTRVKHHIPDLRYDTNSAGPYNSGQDLYAQENPPTLSGQQYTHLTGAGET